MVELEEFRKVAVENEKEFGESMIEEYHFRCEQISQLENALKELPLT